MRIADCIAKLKALDHLSIIDDEVTCVRGVHDQCRGVRPEPRQLLAMQRVNRGIVVNDGANIDTTVDLEHIHHKRPQLKPFVSCPSTAS